MEPPVLLVGDLFEAVATGDIPTIAAYFAQRHVHDEVVETNAFVLANRPSPLLPRGPRLIPWFHLNEIRRRFTAQGFLFGVAVENGRLEVLQWFFTSHERVETMGATLAMLLPAIGHCTMFAGDCGVDVVEILLTSRVYEACLSADEKLHLLNRFLISAARGPTMLPLLIAHGASVDYQAGGRLVEPLVSLTNRDPSEFRRLNRDLNHVRMLVDHGAFVVSSHAISRGSFVFDPRVAHCLVEMGADWRGDNAQDVLVDADLVKRLMCVRIPIEIGFADVDLQDYDGRTLLMLALADASHVLPASDMALGVVRLLLDHNADVNIKDSTGKTALHFAIENERSREALLLLEAGADPNATTHDGRRPVDDCLWLPLREVLVELLERGADPFVVLTSGLSLHETLLSTVAGTQFVEMFPQFFVLRHVRFKKCEHC